MDDVYSEVLILSVWFGQDFGILTSNDVILAGIEDFFICIGHSERMLSEIEGKIHFVKKRETHTL